MSEKRSFRSWKIVFLWERVPGTALSEGSRKIISVTEEQSPGCSPGNEHLPPVLSHGATRNETGTNPTESLSPVRGKGAFSNL